MKLTKFNGYALFDLDQTLVPWDMQLLFANWIFKEHPTRRVLLLPFLSALPLTKVLGARRLKRLFLGILYNLSIEEVDEITTRFVNHYFPSLFYPEVMARLNAHKSRGDLVILTSASPCLYVKKIGKKLGVDHTFCTQVSTPEYFPLVPGIKANNKCEQKIVALEEWFNTQEHNYSFPLKNSTAYTDSTADLPLIRVSEQAVLINPSLPLITQAKGLGKSPEVLTPERPFNTKGGKVLAALKLMFGLYPITLTRSS